MTANTFHLTDRLRDACAAEPVVVAYVFGSVARGRTDAESDIDVAVLADGTLPKAERQRLRFHLARLFAERLAISADRLDIVILQDVPILLQYNVIRGGLAIYRQTPTAQKEYELAVERRYDDESPLLDREADLTIDRILSRAA